MKSGIVGAVDAIATITIIVTILGFIIALGYGIKEPFVIVVAVLGLVQGTVAFFVLKILVLIAEEVMDTSKHVSAPPSQKRTGGEDRPTKWTCPQCQHVNPHNTFRCEKCEYSLT